MREKSCVIIGAGLSGLSAGYMLAAGGWKTLTTKSALQFISIVHGS
jgi:monoamine oxidase